ncbi:MAG: GGDEF domain-containing protein [Candidatus Dormibacteria bacterium]
MGGPGMGYFLNSTVDPGRPGIAGDDARTFLSRWLDIHPSTLKDVPSEPVETLVTLLDAFGLASDESRDLRSQLAGAHERALSLEALARTDHLTGIPNRRAVEERLQMEWERARRYQRPLSVIAIDVDRLKQTNDTHGHLAGDALLREVGERLNRRVRAGDYVGRVGGDEFVVVCPEADAEAARLVAQKLVSLVMAEPVVERGHTIPVSISVGWATGLTETASDLLRHADEALYRSKGDGRGRSSGPAV